MARGHQRPRHPNHHPNHSASRNHKDTTMGSPSTSHAPSHPMQRSPRSRPFCSMGCVIVGLIRCMILLAAAMMLLWWHQSGIPSLIQWPSGWHDLDLDFTESFSAPSERLHVAVIVAGTLQRYMLRSSVERLIKPMVKQNIQVDYYLALTTAFAKAYRSNVGYMDRIHWDPIFTNGTIVKDPPNYQHAEKTIRDQIVLAGGDLKRLILQEYIEIDEEPLLARRREEAMTQYPDEDPDSRFPILDLRPAAMARTANANRNLLRLHLATLDLWKSATGTEQTEFQMYDYVFFLRDDSMWLDNFNFRKLLRNNPRADVYLLSCDDRSPRMQPEEINDHALIATRRAAGFFGNYYNTLFQLDMNACKERLSPASSSRGSRGCNSEMILKFAMQQAKIKAQAVGQAEIPFQRSVNVKTDEGQIQQCFHKFCQSRKNRLEIAEDPNIFPRCHDMEFSSVL